MWTTWVKYAKEDLVASGPLFAIWFQDLVKWVTIGIEANPKIAVHPGLVKWLKEQGAWKSDWKVGKLTK